MKDSLDKLAKAIANDVTKNMDSATEYLKEEGVEYEKITKELVGKIKNFIATSKLEHGKSRQLSLRNALKMFLDTIEGLSLEAVRSRYPGIPQVVFSKLKEQELSQEEIDSLLEDSAFLAFLVDYESKQNDNEG